MLDDSDELRRAVRPATALEAGVARPALNTTRGLSFVFLPRADEGNAPPPNQSTVDTSGGDGATRRDQAGEQDLETGSSREGTAEQGPPKIQSKTEDARPEFRGVKPADATTSERAGNTASEEGETPVVPWSKLKYTDRQMLMAQSQSNTTPHGLLIMVTNRKHRIPWHYVFLRMRADHFWAAIVAISLFIAVCGAILFGVLAGQPPVNAILLSLDAHGLSVGDVYCANRTHANTGWFMCRFVAVLVRLNVFVCELFFGGLIIVRLSRVVVKNRFKFSDFCVLSADGKELVLRMVSNRPSTVVLPNFILEYMDVEGKRLHPLELTNAGSTAYLNDSTFFLRHYVDKRSPFADPDWRKKILGIRVAVTGYDDLLAAEACGCRYYPVDAIRDDVDFGDMVSTATLDFNKLQHKCYLVDMRKINACKERPVRPEPELIPEYRPTAPITLTIDDEVSVGDDGHVVVDGRPSSPGPFLRGEKTAARALGSPREKTTDDDENPTAETQNAAPESIAAAAENVDLPSRGRHGRHAPVDALRDDDDDDDDATSFGEDGASEDRTPRRVRLSGPPIRPRAVLAQRSMPTIRASASSSFRSQSTDDSNAGAKDRTSASFDDLYLPSTSPSGLPSSRSLGASAPLPRVSLGLIDPSQFDTRHRPQPLFPRHLEDHDPSLGHPLSPGARSRSGSTDSTAGGGGAAGLSPQRLRRFSR